MRSLTWQQSSKRVQVCIAAPAQAQAGRVSNGSPQLMQPRLNIINHLLLLHYGQDLLGWQALFITCRLGNADAQAVGQRSSDVADVACIAGAAQLQWQHYNVIYIIPHGCCGSSASLIGVPVPTGWSAAGRQRAWTLEDHSYSTIIGTKRTCEYTACLMSYSCQLIPGGLMTQSRARQFPAVRCTYTG